MTSIPNGSGNWLGSLSKGVKGAITAREAVPSQERVEAVPEPEKPVVAPPASVTESVVPTAKTEETPVAVVEAAKEQPVVVSEKPKQRVVRIDEDDTLVEIPGMQSKSVGQLKFELKKSQDLTRAEGDIRFREEQLRRDRENFEREKKVKPVVEIKAPVVEDVAPTAPSGAVPGDPEHDAYLVELGAYKATQRLKPQLDRMVADLDERRASETAVRQNEVQAIANVEANRRLYGESLSALPFSIESLSESAQEAVAERIRAEAMDAGIDLRNGAHLRALSPSEMRLIFRSAFPPGSRPPGYTEEKPLSVESPELRQLRENDGKPLIEKEKLVPLHNPGSPGISVPKREAATQSGGWQQRLSAKGRELIGI